MQLSEIQKFQIIVKHNDGYAIREIAKSMGINKSTVHMWILRYKNNNTLKKKAQVGKIRNKLNNL